MSSDMLRVNQTEVVLDIIRKHLQTQMEKGYGIATFSVHIQDGRIVLIKCNQETSVKIGG